VARSLTAPQPAVESDTPCLHCGTRLGVELCVAIVHDDPSVGIVGFLHATVCKDAYWLSQMGAASFEPIRLVALV
jgi:hypothetical protein